MQIPKLQNYQFSHLEKTLINDLLEYCQKHNIESARIIKNNKNITDTFSIIEKPTSAIVLPKGYAIPRTNSEFEEIKNIRKRLLKNSTYIHYHPMNLPLSLQDIALSCVNKFEKIIAVTSEKKISLFEPKGNLEKIQNELTKLNQRLRDFISHKGGEDIILKNPQKREKYSRDIENLYSELCKKYGGKYYSNINK